MEKTHRGPQACLLQLAMEVGKNDKRTEEQLLFVGEYFSPLSCGKSPKLTLENVMNFSRLLW